jgi:hypothetical protein
VIFFVQSVHADLVVPATTTSLVLSNFSLSTVYLIRGLAFTSLGPGPASTPVFFTLDPLAAAAGGRDAIFSPGTEELGGQAWFIALIAGVLFVLVCIFIMVLVYRQISGNRKSMAAAGGGHHCLKELEIKVSAFDIYEYRYLNLNVLDPHRLRFRSGSKARLCHRT